MFDPEIWGPPPVRRPLLNEAALRQIALMRPAESVAEKPTVEFAREWFAENKPHLFSEFSEEHVQIYSVVDQVTADYTPPPTAACLPRGHGKTTTLDLSLLRLMSRQIPGREVMVYLAANLEKARARVGSLLKLVESDWVRRRWPLMSMPAITEAGSKVAWGSSMFTNAIGQTVVAASLGSDNRGYNYDQNRVGILVCDDLDKLYDTLATTKRKEGTLTHDVMPAESSRLPAAVFYIQNKIKMGGIMDRVIHGQSTFCRNGTVIGPQVAVEGLEVEPYEVTRELKSGQRVTVTNHRIVAGRATWAGQSLEDCQKVIDRDGLDSFMREQQQHVNDFAGALLTSDRFRYWEGDSFRPFDDCDLRIVGVDPSGGSAECGIVACGAAEIDDLLTYFVLEDRSHEITPADDWAETAVLLAVKYRCMILCETNYGAGMAIKSLEDAADRLIQKGRISYRPDVEGVHAEHSKKDRAIPVRSAYISGRVTHLEKFVRLENEWTTWDPSKPGSKNSPNRLDAEVHAIVRLRDELSGNEGPTTSGGTY